MMTADHTMEDRASPGARSTATAARSPQGSNLSSRGCNPRTRPHTPPSAPLSPRAGRGEGGEGATFPGALPPATHVQPLRGCAGDRWFVVPRGIRLPFYGLRCVPGGLGDGFAGELRSALAKTINGLQSKTPSQSVMVFPEIAGTRSPGTMMPTRFNGSAAERVTISGCRGASRCAPTSA